MFSVEGCNFSFPSGMEGTPCWSVTPHYRNPREGVGLALGEFALSVLRFDVSGKGLQSLLEQPPYDQVLETF